MLYICLTYVTKEYVVVHIRAVSYRRVRHSKVVEVGVAMRDGALYTLSGRSLGINLVDR
jgi:hypothetical protein